MKPTEAEWVASEVARCEKNVIEIRARGMKGLRITKRVRKIWEVQAVCSYWSPEFRSRGFHLAHDQRRPEAPYCVTVVERAPDATCAIKVVRFAHPSIEEAENCVAEREKLRARIAARGTAVQNLLGSLETNQTLG